MTDSDQKPSTDAADASKTAASDGAANAAPDLEARLAAAESALAEMTDTARRTMAEFQNFKARASKDAASARRFVIRDTALGFLPAFDNLERALGAAEQGGDAASLSEGVRLTLQTLVDGLGRIGMTRIAAKPGTPFDPSCMDALARLESTDQPDGAVLSEWESGWRLGDLVVRPARVSVAAAPKTQSPPAPEAENKSDAGDAPAS